MPARTRIAGLVLTCLFAQAPGRGAAVRIGAEAVVPEHPRSRYNRYVNWRPADGETVRLNPPRVSWPYWSDWPGNWSDAQHTFRLQISSRPDCSAPVVDVSCAYNFYNTLPALQKGRRSGPNRWYWRVGYDVGSRREKWSRIRSFTVAQDAILWDRSALARLRLAADDHPRILFNAANLGRVRKLAQTDPGSAAALGRMRRDTDKILRKPWWDEFPTTDRQSTPKQSFYTIARDLATVCFVWRMTGDARYAGVKERAVTWASYPSGGRASPEGLGGDGNEDATQGNEFLALLFDWLYRDLNDEQRRIMIRSLEWRVDHVMNKFSWRRRGSKGPMLRLTFSGVQGDKRLTLRPAGRWRAFTWEVAVPAHATRVEVEAFNYYARGEVWWDALHVRARADGPDLLRNGDFSRSADGKPAGWRSGTFRTGSKLRYDPRGGRDGAGAVGIVCADAADRGAWGQSLPVGDARKLIVTGWYRTSPGMQVAPVRASGMAGMIGSHPFEATMDTAACGLALLGHSEIGQEWCELMLNYLIGVTCGHGFDEAWNEGAGYGTSKCKWLMNATLYFDTALPDAKLGRNPFYRRLGEWFRRVIPVGMPHHAWGNQRNASRWNHRAHFRKFAYLTGDGRFLYNWQQYGGREASKWRPWIEYVLPAYYDAPKPAPETDPVGLFPIAGWAMAASGPPSDRRTYEKGVGVIFQCRTRGGYGHSFNSDGSFQLHAYGQMVNHGGGSSGNRDAYAYHTMSHNTILIDGLGQAQPRKGMRHPTYGRIVGFSRGKDHVYFAGDPTRCYPSRPGNYARWGLPLGKVYQKRALPHLKRFVRHILFLRAKYFVIYDDLECSRPATYTWLYHILPAEPIRFTPQPFTVDYAVGDVKVRLRHIAHPDGLKLDDRKGLDAFVNPFTGEDYRAFRKGSILCGHNLWVTNTRPAKTWRFLTVIYPAAPGTEIPAIERLDDASVRIGNDIVSFDPDSPAAGKADFVVDVSAMRARAPAAAAH